MEFPLEKVLKTFKIAKEPLSLETPIGDEEDSHLGDFIEDKCVLPPPEVVEQNKLQEDVHGVLMMLTPREEKIMRMRFGIGYETDHTLDEVGQAFEVTRERIRQIEAKVLKKLRHPSRSSRIRGHYDPNYLPKRKVSNHPPVKVVGRNTYINTPVTTTGSRIHPRIFPSKNLGRIFEIVLSGVQWEIVRRNFGLDGKIEFSEDIGRLESIVKANLGFPMSHTRVTQMKNQALITLATFVGHSLPADSEILDENMKRLVYFVRRRKHALVSGQETTICETEIFQPIVGKNFGRKKNAETKQRVPSSDPASSQPKKLCSIHPGTKLAKRPDIKVIPRTPPYRTTFVRNDGERRIVLGSPPRYSIMLLSDIGTLCIESVSREKPVMDQACFKGNKLTLTEEQYRLVMIEFVGGGIKKAGINGTLANAIANLNSKEMDILYFLGVQERSLATVLKYVGLHEKYTAGVFADLMVLPILAKINL